MNFPRDQFQLFGLMLLTVTLPALASDELPLIESINDLVPCTLDSSTGLSRVEARCGWLEVPENPEQPKGGLIRLHVALAPAVDESAGGSPLAILAGGPGQAASDVYASRGAAFSRVRMRHPILILDQRGTGRSNLLQCELQEEADDQDYSREAMQEVTRDCLAKLRSDPRHYTTSAAVRDLDRAREVLGYDQLNLWGGSYGTRVAMHYLKRFPAETRSVIIDGVVPIDTILGPGIALDAQATLDAILERCDADESCSSAFPGLRQQLAILSERLRADPVEVTTPDPVTGEPVTTEFGIFHLGLALRLLSYSPQTVALMPLLISEAAGGNFGPLTGQVLMISDDLGENLALGMHNAVMCTEDMPFLDPSSIDREALEQTYLGPQQIDGLVAICEIWPQGFIDEDFHEVLSSDTPVLLLSGEFDPVTPPANADRVQASLRNARHLVVAGQGHGQLSVGCVPRLLGEFVEDPAPMGLDASCLEEVSADGFFVDFNGPSP